MTNKEKRNQAMKAKATEKILGPIFGLTDFFIVRVFLYILFFIILITVLVGGTKLFEMIQSGLTIGYLPDGEYVGTIKGQECYIDIDRTRLTDNKKSWVVETTDCETGDTRTYYLFFSAGSLRFSADEKGRIAHKGDAVKKDKQGQYTVTSRYGKEWAVFASNGL